ncbi:ThiF family adenylyltransferase [Actinoplanes oblitus]|uniref:ThiF family adenylyltransferase n=1 Tax=Actinoplanes oblitus TaxID=3040509 RepID=A0ABY8WT02_9ACTN|nr:ThiF family adenylyltransferase [Actinoplanes oblitus]WIM99419.1 ThiF family adenylyltransferase [Actinoplanes oblitus]
MTARTAPDRYARQRLVPQWDQDRLAAATVVICGAGALGNEAAKNLALAGVGRLVLCDPDVVAASNLSRCVLFGPEDVGRPKVAAAAAALARLAPGVEVEQRPADLVRGAGLGELAGAVTLGCLDSRQGRLQLLGRCALAEAPLVDGGTSPWGGEVRIRLSAADACYACALTARQRADPDARIGCDAPRGERARPASIVSTSIVAGWLTQAALRILFGVPPAWRFLEIDGLTGGTAPVRVSRDPDCLHHRPLGRAQPIPVSARSTVADLVAACTAVTGEPDAEPQSWAPFAIPTRCRRCGTERIPDAGQGPGSVACPACGGPVRLRVSQDLRGRPPRTRLAELGVPAEEIVTVRSPKGSFTWVRLAR